MSHFGDKHQRPYGSRTYTKHQLRKIFRALLCRGDNIAVQTVHHNVFGTYFVVRGHHKMRQDDLLGVSGRNGTARSGQIH